MFTQSRASIKGFLGTGRSIRTHLTHATVESIQSTRKSSTTFIAYQTNTPSTNTTHSLPEARNGLVQQITTSLQSVSVCSVICIVSINTRRVVLSNDTDQLTEREIEVMRLVKKGLSSTRIGKMLCISSNTVNNHRRSVLRKTHTVSTDLAIRYLEFIGVI